MKILFYGDSITDMGRERVEHMPSSMGFGYPFIVSSELYKIDPEKYDILNHGVSGDRTIDLYARIKADVWNDKPDVLSILVGINDILHEVEDWHNGVDIVRFEKFYRMIIEDTLERLPNVKIMLLEPFVLDGKLSHQYLDELLKIKDYAKIIKKLAKEYNLVFVPLQEKFDQATKNRKTDVYLFDGIHPTIQGSNIIAGEWLKAFKENIDK